ncbi:CHAT domain-containing protein [Russula earlei]|uniref:CHAT domain-containing protein n=1 Tax=Russula earlei TaxID=71964 RepID=A0ACC0UK43_9AGAM|nr:CHAT domain-containing protein [Russula earlei]
MMSNQYRRTLASPRPLAEQSRTIPPHTLDDYYTSEQPTTCRFKTKTWPLRGILMPATMSCGFSPLTVSVPETDDHSSRLQTFCLSLPRFHPWRRSCIHALAETQFMRYTLSDREDDLNYAVLFFTEAILLTLPLDQSGDIIIKTFFSLQFALLRRSHRFRRTNDVDCCVKGLQYLRYLSLETFDVRRDMVTAALVQALSIQVELGSGEVVANVDKMTALCTELLASNAPETLLIEAITVLAGTVMIVEPSDQVIECLRLATRRLPGSHGFSIVLAKLLFIRFFLTCRDHVYNEAMAILVNVITTRSPGDNPSSFVSAAMNLAVRFSFARIGLTSYGHPKCIEGEIHRFRVLLASTPLEDPGRHLITQHLLALEKTRHHKFGVPDGVHSSTRELQVVDLPSSFSQPFLQKSSTPPVMSNERDPRLDILLFINCLNDIADIQQAIEYCRVLYDLYARFRHRDPFMLRFAVTLGTLLFRNFERTSNIEYLNESITVYRDILEMSCPEWVQLAVVRQLVFSLSYRFRLLRDRKDFDELVQRFPRFVNDRNASVYDRFQISCQWAWDARISGHASASTAYEKAISLMQDALLFFPTVEMQPFDVVAARNIFENLPLDYASYRIHIGQPMSAIETLERGRALLWSEMLGPPVSIDHLRAINTPLIEKFAAINRKLEALTASGSQRVGVSDAKFDGGVGVDTFDRLVVKRRRLVKIRNKLILQVQALPGFERFLTAPSFHSLQAAALHGPVIVINHSKWRSDILILLPRTSPSLIPMDGDFYDRAIELRSRLFHARRKHLLESKQYQRALRSVLRCLYELVGRPVIQELRKLNISEQSRVWWCPTSVFCSLPLHAMGPIPSGDKVKHYFSDLYISSYTPTLSALITSQKSDVPVLKKPSILLVPQPGGSMRELEETWVVQRLDTSVTTLKSKKATRSGVVEGLQNHRFAHFACHVELWSGRLSNPSLKLHGGERLTLPDLVLSRPPTAEFAFLSACHPTEMTEEEDASEELHFPAAVQYCGFRSVAGTMWGMADVDGPDLVEHFYKSMFSNDESNVPYYERSARALRDAVMNLRRKKGVTLERWVNFVHFGA